MNSLFDFDYQPVPAPKAVVPVPIAPPAPKRNRNFFDNHALAFRAAAKHYGHTDPALASDDPAELARFANELLRGVRSDRPAMTPERWGEARAKVLEIGKVAA